MTIPSLAHVATISEARDADALVVLLPSPLADHLSLAGPAEGALRAALAIDQGLARGPRAPVVLAASDVPGGRLVLSVMGLLRDEIDDVRAVAEAARDATLRAVEAGARRPVLLVGAPLEPRFARAREVAALAALGSQWAPLEAREAERAPKTAEAITVVGLTADEAARASALELGRALCRDITGTDPERMAPLRAAELCESAFRGTAVTATVERDVSAYPLLAAVARASQVVARHRPAVVKLEYVGEGPIERTIVLVGKGVTYDTGGADLKTDGAMAGMSRDKGGAGAVAGTMRALAALRPKGVRVIGLLGFVRNSIGEDAYVTDEIVVARSKVRVRIGNTDAEGRLVLADLLALGRELVHDQPSPLLATVATLTGHVYRAFGPYVGVVGNKKSGAACERIAAIGETFGELCERSFARREDYAFVAARSPSEDVVSSNRMPSVSTPRGHQFPYAFLDLAAGLRNSGLPFVHIDIAGVAVDPPDWQFGKPTGVPVATLTTLVAEG
jgi:leucyl aminopeptidase